MKAHNLSDNGHISYSFYPSVVIFLESLFSLVSQSITQIILIKAVTFFLCRQRSSSVVTELSGKELEFND